MTDSHDQLAAWLVDGAKGDPPREIAVHASVCESCMTRLGAFDALALIDVGAAGSPPPLAAPTRLRVGMAWARRGAAVAGTVAAGILIAFGVSQLAGLGGPASGPAGEPEGTELAGRGNPSDGGAAQSGQPSGSEPIPSEAPTAPGFETPLPGVTPGPLPFLPPGATPRPPTPGPSATAAPTPTLESAAPTPTLESATPTPTPTAPGAPSSLTAQPGAGSIDLDWAPPANDGGNPISGYNLYRSDDSVTFVPVASVGEATYADATVSPGLTYYYYVTALNDFGESGQSNVASATAP